MASLTAFHHFHSISTSIAHHHHHPHLSPAAQLPLSISPLKKHKLATHGRPPLTLTHKLKPSRLAFAAEDSQISEQPDESATTAVDPAVSVPVSPSDKLLMHFQAEGTLTETAVPNVSKALEGVEGVSDLRVQVFEGIASVELTKETTIQATGVASGLVELIQGSGFKLQTLNLSFEDEEELVAA